MGHKHKYLDCLSFPPYCWEQRLALFEKAPWSCTISCNRKEVPATLHRYVYNHQASYIESSRQRKRRVGNRIEMLSGGISLGARLQRQKAGGFFPRLLMRIPLGQIRKSRDESSSSGNPAAVVYSSRMTEVAYSR